MVGVFLSLALSWWSGTLTWTSFRDALLGATRTSCMIAFILAGAAYPDRRHGLHRHSARAGRMDQRLQPAAPGRCSRVLTLFYIVLGCFLDGISMVVLTTSIIMPLVREGRLRPDLVRHLRRAGGGDGADHAAGRLQSLRPAGHDRAQHFHHRRLCAAAVLPDVRRRGAGGGVSRASRCGCPRPCWMRAQPMLDAQNWRGPGGFAAEPPSTYQPACKPGSVWPAASNRRRDGHSSGTPVARRIKQPTRMTGPDGPEACAPTSFLFGLAPGGVCRAASVAGSAVRSYRTVSPLPRPKRYAAAAVCSLWHCP